MKPFPVKIHPFFWVFAFIIGWLNSLSLAGSVIWVFVILISVFIHECGHAFTALAFGQKVRIEIVFYGGYTYREGPALKLWQDFIIILCGPLASFLLYVLGYYWLPHIDNHESYLFLGVEILTLVNLVWTVLNLIPVFPLDGGRLLSIILEAIFGFKGTKFALVFGVVLGFALGILFMLIGQLFLAILFFLLAMTAYQSTPFLGIMQAKDRDPILQKEVQEGREHLKEGKVTEALQLFQQVRDKTGKGVLYTMATEEMAATLELQHKENEAYALLRDLPKRSTESTALYHRLAFVNKDYAAVVAVATQAYQTNPGTETALLNAMSFGALGDATSSAGWLECAVHEGVREVQAYLQRSEFDPVRHDPLFRKYEGSAWGL